nr:protein NYNRIN-like [Dermacentor andersoni]
MLQQLSDGTRHPTTFFSRKLKPTERRYSTFGHELLAVYSNTRFDHVHLDIVGPLPPCQENAYLLPCIDRFTRWAEAIPRTDITADTVARAFLHHLVARFGAPSIITTDRGRQFESSLFASITRFVGASRIGTTTYHPISNGLVERFHRQLKYALAATEERNWTEALPLILLGIRTAVKTDIGCSAAELVYGTTLRLPGEFFTGSP